MYKKHFGFKERPFRLLPDPAYLFVSPSHEKALAHLIYAVKEGDGLFTITGKAGTGKTTLCRAFIEKLDDNVEAAFISNPGHSAIDLLKTVCNEFGISVKQGSTIKDLNDVFKHFLHARKADGKHVMLIVDEAQKLSFDVLEQIRLLSNLETSKEKLLQIVLVGQLELNDLLNTHELQQLQQRITLNCQLLPLTFEELMRYIQHRIYVAAQKDYVFFDVQAFRKIYSFSKGVPRLINIICDKALLCAFVTNRKKVSGTVVDSAIQQSIPSGQEKVRQRGSKTKKIVSAAGVLCLAAFLFIVVWPTVSKNLLKMDTQKTYNTERTRSQNTSVEPIASRSNMVDTNRSSLQLFAGNNSPEPITTSDGPGGGSLSDNGIVQEVATKETELDVSESALMSQVAEKTPILASSSIPAISSTPDVDPDVPIEPYVENNLPETQTTPEKQTVSNPSSPAPETNSVTASAGASGMEPTPESIPAGTDKPLSQTSKKNGQLEKQAEPSKEIAENKRPFKETEQISETPNKGTPAVEGDALELVKVATKPDVSESAPSLPVPEKKEEVLLASATAHDMEPVPQGGQDSADEPSPSEENSLPDEQTPLEQNDAEKENFQMALQPESETLVANLSQPTGNTSDLQMGTASKFKGNDALSDSLYKLNEVDKKPKLVRAKSPIYPEVAKRKDIKGWVVLQFIVDTKGRTENVEVLESDPKGIFEAAALKAVEKYKFKPAVKNGKDVNCIVKQRIRFEFN